MKTKDHHTKICEGDEETKEGVDTFALEEIAYRLKGIGVLVRGLDAYADAYGRSEKGEEETQAVALIEEVLNRYSDRLFRIIESE